MFRIDRILARSASESMAYSHRGVSSTGKCHVEEEFSGTEDEPDDKAAALADDKGGTFSCYEEFVCPFCEGGGVDRNKQESELLLPVACRLKPTQSQW